MGRGWWGGVRGTGRGHTKCKYSNSSQAYATCNDRNSSKAYAACNDHDSSQKYPTPKPITVQICNSIVEHFTTIHNSKTIRVELLVILAPGPWVPRSRPVPPPSSNISKHCTMSGLTARCRISCSSKIQFRRSRDLYPSYN